MFMEKRIIDFYKIVVEADRSRDHLTLEPLRYDKKDLETVTSEETLNYHYNKLAKLYVDRFNNREGDDTFNRAGAFLHNILFQQFQKPSNNKPFGSSLEFINKHFKNLDNLKQEVEKVAMSIQGSGWVYISVSGKIEIIKNHQIKNNILLLIDWWEHAWALDYQADKSKYLKNIWRIIDWKVINDRLILL